MSGQQAHISALERRIEQLERRVTGRSNSTQPMPEVGEVTGVSPLSVTLTDGMVIAPSLQLGGSAAVYDNVLVVYPTDHPPVAVSPAAAANPSFVAAYGESKSTTLQGFYTFTDPWAWLPSGNYFMSGSALFSASGIVSGTDVIMVAQPELGGAASLLAGAKSPGDSVMGGSTQRYYAATTHGFDQSVSFAAYFASRSGVPQVVVQVAWTGTLSLNITSVSYGVWRVP